MKRCMNIAFVAFLSALLSCSSAKKIPIDTFGMNIVSGRISSYDFTGGTKGSLIDSVEIDSETSKITVGPEGSPTLIELTGASFIEPSSGDLLKFGQSDVWRTVIISMYGINDENPLQINPFTTMGTSLIAYKAAYSNDLEQTVLTSKKVFKDHFKMDIDDSPSTGGKDGDYEASLSSEQLIYYLLVGGFGQLAMDISDGNGEIEGNRFFTVLELTDKLSADIGYDGIADGKDENGQIYYGYYKFSSSTLTRDLADAVKKFMQKNEIEMTDELSAIIQQIQYSSSDLVFIMDSGLYSGDIYIDTLRNDNFISGVNQVIYLSIEADVEGGLIEGFIVKDEVNIPLYDTDPDPELMIAVVDTTLFEDGLIHILARAYDSLGKVVNRMFPLFIDNSPPSITTSLQEGQFVQDALRIDVNVSDGSGVGGDSLIVKLDGEILLNSSSNSQKDYTVSYDSTGTNDGTHTINLESEDSFGNKTEVSYSIFVNNNVLSEDTFVKLSGSGLLNSVSKVIFAGDLNDDGYSDILSGANSILNKPAVFLGSSTNNYASYITINSVNISSEDNVSMAANCDIDNNGKADFVVGDYQYFLGRGRLKVCLGPVIEAGYCYAAWVLHAPVTNNGQHFGKYLACADLNGDGYDDVIATMDEDRSISYIYYGPSLETRGEFRNHAAELTVVGDVNGDGIKDVAEGNFLVYGSRSGNFSLATILTDYTSIAPAGDVNNDGYDDILIALLPDDSGRNGTAFLYYGGPQFPTKKLQFYCPYGDDAAFGESVAAGDIDGNGYTDILISAPSRSPRYNGVEISHAGTIYAYLGPDFNETMEITAETLTSDAHFGVDLSSGFDLNFDGLADLITQEPGNSLWSQQVGSFHVIYDLNE